MNNLDTYFDVLRMAHDAVGRALAEWRGADALSEGATGGHAGDAALAPCSLGSRAPWVVDATVGNGHDTLFLARAVGERGWVVGFDVQKTALDAARERLAEAGVADRVTLFHAGHERMAELLPAEAAGRVAAVVFNLGYLPGSDKTVVTTPETTTAALDAALALLAPLGVLSIVAYPAHPGGSVETETVRAWCACIEDREVTAMEYGMANRPQAKRLFLAARLR